MLQCTLRQSLLFTSMVSMSVSLWQRIERCPGIPQSLQITGYLLSFICVMFCLFLVILPNSSTFLTRVWNVDSRCCSCWTLDVGRWTWSCTSSSLRLLSFQFLFHGTSHYYNNAFLICWSLRPAHNLTLDKHGMEFTNTAPLFGCHITKYSSLVDNITQGSCIRRDSV